MDGAAVDTLRVLGLLARRPLTGCSLPPRCRISLPLGVAHDEVPSYANLGFRGMAAVDLAARPPYPVYLCNLTCRHTCGMVGTGQ